ncbi:CAP domain-containing protein [Gillisia sp. M10.2A]|uniref:CAP domain-containing protein n=1 Tax=Gillisia lutea TaxID=2909668 RepID=A0ABS9ELY8_9FLAO|nr:CAP domain-containing protein [Gillisia lutea]MCF4102825.1 CAP domain-containing protein [Gillisia lutea]
MLTSTKQLCIALLCVFTFASCSQDSEIPEDTVALQTAELGDNVPYSALESEILIEVNKYRASKGLSSLSTVDNITFEAEGHTDYMASNEIVNHDNFEKRYQNLVKEIGARAMSENVAFGYRNAKSVVEAWIASEGHRVNIEGNYTHFGIAVEKDKDGRNYFTNIFVRR